MFTIIDSIGHYTGGSSPCNQARNEIEREEDLKRRNKTTFIYRQYDVTHSTILLTLCL